MTSVTEAFFGGMFVGALPGGCVGVLVAWAVFRARENRQIHHHVVEMTRNVTTMFEAALKRKEPKRAEEERPAT